jgi:hypothetical protein
MAIPLAKQGESIYDSNWERLPIKDVENDEEEGLRFAGIDRWIVGQGSFYYMLGTLRFAQPTDSSLAKVRTQFVIPAVCGGYPSETKPR